MPPRKQKSSLKNNINSKNRKVKILITKDYQLQCFIVDEKNETETLFYLNENDEENER